MNIVLVHGIFDNGGIFQPLVQALERDGHRCWAPALKPADGRTGIAELAIVGFSMGCIVSRYYLQMLSGAARTKVFFAISGPHSGTLMAYMYPGQGARDLRPDSPLLQALKQSEGRLSPVELFAYWTSRDLMILPATSCCWPLATYCLNAKVLIHRSMPSSALVRDDIVRRMREIQDARGAHAFEKGVLSAGSRSHTM
jgi:triacylglycerol lipase